MSETTQQAQAITPIHGGAVTAILKLLDHNRLMTLATVRSDGHPQISTLGYLNDGLNLYFITARTSEKRRNILADPRVSLAIRGRAEEGEAVGVSIDGHAVEVSPAQEAVDIVERLQARTPDQNPWAPASEDVVVMKVIPETIKAVAILEGRSRSQAFSLGEIDAVTGLTPYEPSAIARLF